jgi:hypothetical protein
MREFGNVLLQVVNTCLAANKSLKNSNVQSTSTTIQTNAATSTKLLGKRGRKSKEEILNNKEVY